MNKRKNIPLTSLDEYAKILSSKQVNMLHESRLNKKHRPRLLLEEDEPGSVYSVFIPTNVYTREGLTAYGLMNLLQFGDSEEEDKKELTDISFKTKDPSGILVVCKYPLSFKEVLHRIADTDFAEDVAKYVRPERFQACLYPEGCERDI